MYEGGEADTGIGMNTGQMARPENVHREGVGQLMLCRVFAEIEAPSSRTSSG